MKLTGRNYVSHSQLSLMRACPKKFSFQYVEKAVPDFVPSSLLFGQAIHAALELHFRCALEGLSVTPAALLSAFHDAWRREHQDSGEKVPVRFNKGENYDSLLSLADRIIQAFLASPVATPEGLIVGVEEELRVVLSPELPDVLAIVDLVYLGEDALHVVDFKTAKNRWNEQKVAESSDQLYLYAHSTRSMSESLELPVKLHFAVITKAKLPAVQIVDVSSVNTDRSNSLVVAQNVSQVWTAIKAGNFYPAPSPMHCTTCPFKSRCPTFRRE